MAICLESCPKRGERVLTQRALDTFVVLHLDKGEYYALDEVGRRIWELSDGTNSVSQIISIIGQEYDAPIETIEADVIELVEALLDEKLVVEGAGAAGSPEATGST